MRPEAVFRLKNEKFEVESLKLLVLRKTQFSSELDEKINNWGPQLCELQKNG